MEDCIFCKIASGKIPATIVSQDKDIIAFRDINPVAPTHILIIPRKHIVSLAEMGEVDVALAGKMVAVANKLAKQEGIASNGYRLVSNSGKHGTQLVQHLHLHLVGGRQLSPALG